MKRLFPIAIVLAAATSASACGQAADASPAVSAQTFVRRVAPMLRDKCLGCHGQDPDVREGSLDLRTEAGLRQGGDSGEPLVIDGDPEHSPLFLAVRRDHDEWSPMPPKEAERLTDEQLGWLRDWITMGAVWPDTEQQQEISAEFADTWSAEDGIPVATSGGLSADWSHRTYAPDALWAYKPLNAPDTALTIDTFINAALPDGLSVAERADRRTLLRRVTFDLTGLPPTSEEVNAFLRDSRSEQDAFAAVVERLLKSPHYGERMAQHWLDVARYADSSGFSNDFERGNAWRYRDYVVRSFNDDKPYDRFVREQIAGDEIADDHDNAVSSEQLIATGFLRMGPWELTSMEVPRVARQRFLDDVTNSVGEAFLAHSLQCARCHDHKFDPVPTRDYYSIQAVFATTQLTERAAPFLPEENTAGFEEQRWLRQREESYQQILADLDSALLENADQWLKDQGLSSFAWNAAVEQARLNGSGGIFNAARSILTRQQTPEDQFPPRLAGFTPQQFGLDRVARKGLQRLRWEFERYQPYALAVYNGRTPQVTSVGSPVRIPENRLTQGHLEETCILTGGDPFALGEPVTPGTLSVLNQQVTASIPTDAAGRRLEFARWLTDVDNPLTPRVIVNRIWQWHFGRAIAGNPNNFGATGKRPTHPELLDWLAAMFVREDWSVKTLHRWIVMSDVYCRDTRHPDPEQLERLDPERQRYTVFVPRRLSAEELRDAMLLASGELNLTIGGIPCRPEINQEVALQPRQVMGSFAAAWVPNSRPQDRNRRSLYVLRLRGLMDPLLEVFNSPGPDFSCERRETSTVTPQVFALFNGRNTYARALALASLAMTESTDDRSALTHCFRRTLSREPTIEEINELLTHWHDIEVALPERAAAWEAPPRTVRREAIEENTGERFTFEEELFSTPDYVMDLQPRDVDRHCRALADICLVLLNANEFVYVY